MAKEKDKSKPKVVKMTDAEEKKKALESVFSVIEKEYGTGSIMKLGDANSVDVEVIPTGSLTLDMALGVGGLPRGRVIEIYGPESSGKTTVALHVVAEAQKMGGEAAFIDAEHALDPVYAKKLGVDIDNLIVAQPDTGEQALDIAEVLDMTVEEALAFFQNQPKIRDRLQTLMDVGLGYVRLGQPSTTLSGGEAQRIKLATELSKRSTGRTIYVLDEPTTGLHVADVARLIDILNRLTDAGNTVLVIEHNLHVIKVADHIIDLGPEGGDAGGSIVFTGTPEDCARCAESYTGQFLKKELES